MPPAQDHKRAFDGDEGPNTGGMGAFCPIHLERKLQKEIETEIISRAVAGLKKENTPFVGVLYAGVMVTETGPKVLEYNCRFGDPETQVILPLLETDIYEIFQSCVTATLHRQKISWKKNTYTTGVVVASEGYPGPVKTGRQITGFEAVHDANLIAFHGGTKRQDENNVLSSGGRVLTIVAVDSSLHLAAARATAGADLIQLEGSFFRKDIARKELVRCAICEHVHNTDDGLTYKSAGVDIIAGEELVDKIKVFAGSTHRKGVMESLGGFGALFDLKASGFIDPILVSGTDGVGTKLRVALQSKHYNTVGIDLVAMCVNDILVQGAEPLFFLDYFACGQLEVDLAAEVIEGIAKGCRDSGCALVGGETAEMPGMYSDEDFDLAGFCVGAVDRGHLLPRTADMRVGDVIIGLPSSGVHSNGFSLVRKLVSSLGLQYEDPCPFDSNTTLGQALLVPTELYVKPLLSVVRSRLVKGLAHITGGGLTQNIPRILPKNLTADLDASKWNIPPVFEWIMREGHVKEEDMLVTFNCGIGMTVIVDPKDADFVLKQIHANGITKATVIGTLVERKTTEEKVIVRNFSPKDSIERQEKDKCNNKKRVAVLISGSGTNLQALIDSTTGPCSSSSSAEICLVISNIEGVEGLERARRAGIKTVVIAHLGKKRVNFDMEVHACLQDHNIEYVFLAGFMRIISPDFVRLWEGRLINIHPSLLPSFKGMHTHEDALQAGVKVHGSTVHFVDDGVDTGAIILQESTQVLPDDTVATLQERVKTQCEHRIFPLALQLITSGRVSYDKKTRRAVWNK
jgi:phosphoribosylamine--glycine ligase/phosphoribosylglycinamide formyltransferase/phosphoribosylformylglycinamidine cyclo-ligase